MPMPRARSMKWCELPGQRQVSASSALGQTSPRADPVGEVMRAQHAQGAGRAPSRASLAVDGLRRSVPADHDSADHLQQRPAEVLCARLSNERDLNERERTGVESYWKRSLLSNVLVGEESAERRTMWTDRKVDGLAGQRQTTLAAAPSALHQEGHDAHIVDDNLSEGAVGDAEQRAGREDGGEELGECGHRRVDRRASERLLAGRRHASVLRHDDVGGLPDSWARLGVDRDKVGEHGGRQERAELVGGETERRGDPVLDERAQGLAGDADGELADPVGLGAVCKVSAAGEGRRTEPLRVGLI